METHQLMQLNCSILRTLDVVLGVIRALPGTVQGAYSPFMNFYHPLLHKITDILEIQEHQTSRLKYLHFSPYRSLNDSLTPNS